MIPLNKNSKIRISGRIYSIVSKIKYSVDGIDSQGYSFSSRYYEYHLVNSSNQRKYLWYDEESGYVLATPYKTKLNQQQLSQYQPSQSFDYGETNFVVGESGKTEVIHIDGFDNDNLLKRDKFEYFDTKPNKGEFLSYAWDDEEVEFFKCKKVYLKKINSNKYETKDKTLYTGSLGKLLKISLITLVTLVLLVLPSLNFGNQVFQTSFAENDLLNNKVYVGPIISDEQNQKFLLELSQNNTDPILSLKSKVVTQVPSSRQVIGARTTESLDTEKNKWFKTFIVEPEGEFYLEFENISERTLFTTLLTLKSNHFNTSIIYYILLPLLIIVSIYSFIKQEKELFPIAFYPLLILAGFTINSAVGIIAILVVLSINLSHDR